MENKMNTNSSEDEIIKERLTNPEKYLFKYKDNDYKNQEYRKVLRENKIRVEQWR